MFVDDKNDGKEVDLESMWKKLMKHADPEKPTTFLDQVSLGCAQSKWKPNKSFVDDYRNMFESRISAGTSGKLQSSGKSNEKVAARGPMTWWDTHRNEFNGAADWQTRNIDQLKKKSPHIVSMIIRSR